MLAHIIAHLLIVLVGITIRLVEITTHTREARVILVHTNHTALTDHTVDGKQSLIEKKNKQGFAKTPFYFSLF